MQDPHLPPRSFVAGADLPAHCNNFPSYRNQLVFDSANPRRKFGESVHLFLEHRNTAIEPRWRRDDGSIVGSVSQAAKRRTFCD